MEGTSTGVEDATQFKSVIVYEGPARFIGVRNQAFTTDRVLEIVELSYDGSSTATFHCLCDGCGFTAPAYESVRGHLAVHSRQSGVNRHPPKRTNKSVVGDDILAGIEREVARRVEREIERKVSRLKAERDAARAAQRDAERRLTAIRKSLSL